MKVEDHRLLEEKAKASRRKRKEAERFRTKS